MYSIVSKKISTRYQVIFVSFLGQAKKVSHLPPPHSVQRHPTSFKGISPKHFRTPPFNGGWRQRSRWRGHITFGFFAQ